MRKALAMILACVFLAAVAMAQANSNPRPAPQTPMTAPHTTQGDRNASQVDRGVPADEHAGTKAGQADTGTAPEAQPQTPVEPPRATQHAPVNGGVPWGWIIVGIIVIAVILALIGRGGTERVVERRETSERDHVISRNLPPRDDDDIRRAG